MANQLKKHKENGKVTRPDKLTEGNCDQYADKN